MTLPVPLNLTRSGAEQQRHPIFFVSERCLFFLLKRLIFAMCPPCYLCSDDSGLYAFTRTAQRVRLVPKAAILDRILRNSFSTPKHRIPKGCQYREGCIRESRTC